jgi:hypothetical protein
MAEKIPDDWHVGQVASTRSMLAMTTMHFETAPGAPICLHGELSA